MSFSVDKSPCEHDPVYTIEPVGCSGPNTAPRTSPVVTRRAIVPSNSAKRKGTSQEDEFLKKAMDRLSVGLSVRWADQHEVDSDRVDERAATSKRGRTHDISIAARRSLQFPTSPEKEGSEKMVLT